MVRSVERGEGRRRRRRGGGGAGSGILVKLLMSLSATVATMAMQAKSFSLLRQPTASVANRLRIARIFENRHRQTPDGSSRYSFFCSGYTTRATSHSSSSSSALYSSGEEETTPSAKKRIAFLGTPDVAATCLRAVYDASLQPESPYEIAAVITQPPKRRKRKGKPEPSPVGKVADELGLSVLCPEKANDAGFLTALEEEIRPDLCITAAYGQYLPKRFLNTPPCGTVNIHPSLLPKWRGASPVQRSLEAGDDPVGVTVLFTVSKMDAGPIIAQKEQHVDENAMATEVLPMLFGIGTELLVDALPDVLDGKITPETASPQDENLATQATMIDASEGELKVWEESARTCHNRLRGFAYWPQAFLYVKVGDRPDTIKLKVTQTRVVEGADDDEPTDVIRLGPTKKSGLYLTCGDGSTLELLRVQPATRKEFPARDFQNGYPGETIRWVRPPEEATPASAGATAAAASTEQ